MIRSRVVIRIADIITDFAVISSVISKQSDSYPVRARISDIDSSGSSGFGTITAAGDPRVIQLGLKINF